MTTSARLVLTAVCVAAGLPALAQGANVDCAGDGWLEKSDADFAADCAGTAFSGSLEDRERVAWMLFARVNQLIDDPTNGGMSGSGKVPVWMAWPTDPDTFAAHRSATERREEGYRDRPRRHRRSRRRQPATGSATTI